MYTHRGAYLQALAMAFHSRLGLDSTYLWTLPMFHCNGWCFTWAVTAAGAVHICQRQIDPAAIWSEICRCGVTHLCAAPTVLTMIAEAATSSGCEKPGHLVHTFTGGAPPTPALLARLAALNLQVTHLYGLTETYGPSVINDWQPEWNEKSETDKARLNARQGVGNVVTKDIRVVDACGGDVPADGKTLGEIVIRGNNVTTMTKAPRAPRSWMDGFVPAILAYAIQTDISNSATAPRTSLSPGERTSHRSRWKKR
jgi:fatty-acyl-CoA synthase